MKESIKNKQEISIPLIVIIIPFIIIVFVILFSFNTYAKSNKEENKEEIQVEPIEEIKETEIQNEQENQNTITYTSSSGEQYEIIGRLKIESLNIEYPILSTTSESLLKISLTKYWGSNPNEIGNMVVLGHNYKNDKFFGNLAKIKIGDIVNITDIKGNTLNYSVYDTYIIDPNDNSCTSQLTNGKKEITLITCHYENGNPHATKRFVVKAREK